MNFPKESTHKGVVVRIARTCPYYLTFAEKVGWLRRVYRDSVGNLYLVETRNGEKAYLRRSEFTVLSKGKAG